MKKNAMALAVGALFAAPAAQAQIVFGNDKIGTVQIYGKLYPQVASFEGKNATAVGGEVSNLVRNNGLLNASGTNGKNHGQRFAVDSQNSYIGFRGERAVTGSLKAVWQVEQSVGLDGGGDVWSNRNSFVGMSGGFGTVKLGNMDTIYKEYGDTFSMLGVSSGNFVSASNMLSHIGVGNSGTARFHERAKNSIQYQTAEFTGFQAGIQYSPDETGGDPTTTARPANRHADLWSYGIKFDSERFYVSLHQEVHNNFFGGSNNVGQASNLIDVTETNPAGNIISKVPETPDLRSRDRATRLSGELRLGTHRLVGDIARLRYKESGQTAAASAANPRFDSYERTNWALGWDARWGGPWRTAVQYIHANKGKCSLIGVDCNTSGLDGYTVNAGVAYSFDRQTLLYALASKLHNGDSARFDNWANGSPSRGEDLIQYAVGISYTF